MEADLVRIKRCRNELYAHRIATSVADKDFENTWTEIEAALLRLGGPRYQLDIQRLKIESMDPENEKYLNVLLQSWEENELRDIPKRGEMKKDEPPSFCDLPPKPSHNTVDRSYEVSLVMKEIERLRSTYPHQITTTYISGNPGSGKSELARQIGGKYFDDVDSEVSLKFVTTLNASTLDTLIQSYMDFAIQLRCNEMSITTIATSSEKLSQEEKLAHLKGLISPALQKYSSWLIIVDNVEDLQLVSRFIPLAGQRLHGHILVTTQDSQSIPLSDDTYNMSISTGMRSDDAVRSLLSISGYDDGDDIVQQVAETLDFQPLALACAGVYMRQARGTDPSMNWKKCLQKIEQGKRELTERPYEKINSSYRNSMTTAVKMAVKNEIEKNPVILHTFQFMSLMAPEFISLEHVVNYVMKCLPDDDKESVAADIISSSLILKSEEKSKPTVRVHQVLYYVFRIIKLTVFHEAQSEFAFLAKAFDVFSYLKDMNSHSAEYISSTRPLVVHFLSISEKIQNFFLGHQILILTEKNEYGIRYRTNKATQQYIPFVNLLSKVFSCVCRRHAMYETSRMLLEISSCIIIKNCERADPKVTSTLLNLGKVLRDLGKYKEAQECHERALVIKESIYGKNHREVVITLVNLGNVLRDLGKYKEAQECHERALVIKESIYGKNHPEVAITLGNLGNVLRDLGKYKEAQECHERALIIEESIYGKNHPEVAITLGNLGNVLRDLGKYKEAQECHERALAIKESIYGKNHLEVAITLGNLGNELRDLGKYKEAQECHERALAIKESTYGKNHPEVAITLGNLGIVLRDLRKYKEAQECHERALAIKESTCGKNHPKVAITLVNLGKVLRDLRKYKEAQECHERALAIKESIYGKNHPEMAITLVNLGKVLRDLGRYKEAQECYERALAIKESIYGKNHPEVAITLVNLGKVLRDLGRYKEAQECHERALVIKESTYGKNHPEVAITLGNLGKVLRDLGKYKEAQECHERALAIKESIYGKNYPEMAITLVNLGKVLRGLGKYKEAQECHERALIIKESTYGKNHPEVAITLVNLGIALGDLGKYKEAQECHERALVIKESTYGKNHPEVAFNLNNLGQVLQGIEKNQEARVLFERALVINEVTYSKYHPQVAITLNNLGQVLLHLGEDQEANVCLQKALAIKQRTPNFAYKF
ncbi:hypothetical protein QZH41_001070 [Actinostola sp. cb2023]|nr:hypothetical protein QZH41_001070 [Actinostola sp. cb2023]